MCGSPWARLPPMVATLRTRTLESRRMARTMTPARRATSAECSTSDNAVNAPMTRPPSGAAAMLESVLSLRRLTSRVGRNTPAFIISIRAVPPPSGRTEASSGSSRRRASSMVAGSASSNAASWGASRRRGGKGGAHSFGEFLFHLPCLGLDHRLAHACRACPVRLASMEYLTRVSLPASTRSVVASAVKRPTTPSGVPSILASMRSGGVSRVTSTLTLKVKLI